MSAQVVFSDGSRRMAHNNEDLFERWRMRVEANRDDVHRRPDRYVAEFIPSEQPQSIEDAHAMRRDLLAKRDILVHHMTLLKSVYKGKPRSRALVDKVREPYVLASQQIETELRKLGDWLKAHDHRVTEDQRLTLAQEELASVRDARDYWRDRALAAEARLAELTQETAS